MGLKIGITGHTSGFGKHIAKECTQLGHTVLGFSRNNCNLLFDTDYIFTKDLDCIINNADVGNAQVNISTTAYRKKLKCINIGSKITEANVSNLQDVITKDNKIMLKHLSATYKQPYLTWGFTEGHELLKTNPQLLETITIQDAVKEVIHELGTV
jgi:NADP-dependent 3-hydroxy acid dehydrogenase YdfG